MKNSTDTDTCTRQREDMVRTQVARRGITDERVLDALRNVPRHRFVPEELAERAYGDFPLPIGYQQTISQPYIVAEMTQALALDPDDKVLEIGTGSGYQAAILAEIVREVYTVERIEPLFERARDLLLEELGYDNIEMLLEDGTNGWEDSGPFDAIIVTAGAPRIPQPLVRQLAEGGRMIIPVGDEYIQELTKIVKDHDGIHQTKLGGCRFVKLVGKFGWE